MRGWVPLARRNLLADPRRLAASALAVGLALILLLDGLWAGVRAQVTRYEDEIGAQPYVVVPGARSLFADGSMKAQVPVGPACSPAQRTPIWKSPSPSSSWMGVIIPRTMFLSISRP